MCHHSQGRCGCLSRKVVGDGCVGGPGDLPQSPRWQFRRRQPAVEQCLIRWPALSCVAAAPMLVLAHVRVCVRQTGQGAHTTLQVEGDVDVNVLRVSLEAWCNVGGGSEWSSTWWFPPASRQSRVTPITQCQLSKSCRQFRLSGCSASAMRENLGTTTEPLL